MQHFEHRHLRAVPYKGPVLSQSIYGDPGRRSFSEPRLPDFCRGFRASEASSSQNRVPSCDGSYPGRQRLSLRIGYERSFDGAAGRYLVELQWALLPHFYGVKIFHSNGLRVEDLLARAGRTVVGGCEMRACLPRIHCWRFVYTPRNIFGCG